MNNKKSKRALLGSSVVTLMGLMLTPAVSSAADGEGVIREKCLACHTETGNQQTPFSRISEQRKTPEGWMMTLNRMQHRHGLELSGDEVQSVIQYLSDTQGLAPSETASMRYVLEQKPNVIEEVDPAYAEMCSRCHSNARFGLQRRTEGEWKELVNTHMALHPTTELHALARDRAWYDIALNETAPKLAVDYPFNDSAWAKWQQMSKPQLSGRWSVAGFMPGKGDYSATLDITKTAADKYAITLNGHYTDGTSLKGEGSAKVFSGYEWRASLTVDSVKMRQVMAASENGRTLQGRMFETAADEIGGALTAVSGSAIVSLSPSAIKQGQQQQITIIGGDLKGEVSLGNGVKVVKVLSRDADRVVVMAEASANAATGLRNVAVGQAKATAQLAVYDAVASVMVTPNDSIARVGGNGGKLAKVQSHYRALAFSAGADGKPGTKDDMRLGYMPAQWSLQAFDEVAEHDNDLKYAGTIDGNGIFTPGDAGLNTERKMSTNNVGNLKVVAAVQDGGNSVEGEAHLLVTVPTFIKRAIQ